MALMPDAEYIEETIVIAYGTATRNSFTGSASMVSSEEIEARVTTDVTSALAGTAPGVQVISSSGDPASDGPTIRIRGIGSMSASNSPLVIVDGMPYDGRISDINPKAIPGYTDGQYYYIPDDWYAATFGTAFRQEYNLSVSGTGERLSYYASAGYLQDGGIE